MTDAKEKLLKLIDDYGNACLKAGQANSGYCIDPSAPGWWSRMQELRKELKEGIQALGEDNSVVPTKEG